MIPPRPFIATLFVLAETAIEGRKVRAQLGHNFGRSPTLNRR
jgi:hypothetical protein